MKNKMKTDEVITLLIKKAVSDSDSDYHIASNVQDSLEGIISELKYWADELNDDESMEYISTWCTDFHSPTWVLSNLENHIKPNLWVKELETIIDRLNIKLNAINEIFAAEVNFSAK